MIAGSIASRSRSTKGCASLLALRTSPWPWTCASHRRAQDLERSRRVGDHAVTWRLLQAAGDRAAAQAAGRHPPHGRPGGRHAARGAGRLRAADAATARRVVRATTRWTTSIASLFRELISYMIEDARTITRAMDLVLSWPATLDRAGRRPGHETSQKEVVFIAEAPHHQAPRRRAGRERLRPLLALERQAPASP